MQNLIAQQFANELFGNITVLDFDGNLWFIGNEIAAILWYSRPRDAVHDHVDPRDKGSAKLPLPKGGTQETTIINESGLYSLIFSSKLPTAVEFKYWVTSTVLPTMRKIGFDRAIQLLQNEIQRLKESNRVLYQANEHASTLSISRASLNLDYKLLVYNVITCPYLSDEVKIALLKFDITETNPEINLDAIIEAYMTQHNI